MSSTTQVATFGGGCFWCIDAAFRRVNGVLNVSSGYTGGNTDTPTYKSVCSGTSGHAEVVQIEFDDTIISFEVLLAMFFTLHDATQLNRQGNDIGTQYRSVVYYHNQTQLTLTNAVIAQLQNQVSEPIVTEVSPATTYYPAEHYHQDYYNENPNQGYCSILIAPKLHKFETEFKEFLAD
ncbi:peptide-methionine (S)-S-oxide reductase [Pseudoalteromonas nigrifaciens]|uniref:Peptide methionine sulfoxide reductase MsrA n=2 Tax=Alteromonadales TaxID=135622 RepID=A0AAC9UJU2_9GAMM|nr:MULTISPECIES: peptide-methionine (S)-S-oxide reductase MsrA [Pseudoalteromonas]ASM54912.1 peptide-methionine (S)-S-oxide reductase [Pseudoalteromonas nigrifaciens]MBB1406747.1 peptide-methionine (S)-S-oxide reductase MsrA [Pseudoalteromonas sp. SG44-5]MBH0094054.1 peptide-methionine (S)-S-oxide reductase MsrA [Pseudoalteromonas sp. SCQQ13]SUC51275.1 Peptide methionine sulfoxide reductase MsrA [Pseudoalteromonas nigrifaciens]GEN41514.1 peptide methionine sulfoxide reductase MsrA [Pseudoalter